MFFTSFFVFICCFFFFFFNDTATTEIYTLSLHDALPILTAAARIRNCFIVVVSLGICSVSRDRKSTRLNSSHDQISYAVFCLKKKTNRRRNNTSGAWADQRAATCATKSAGRARTATQNTVLFFFLNETAPTEIYTLSLHDALPICPAPACGSAMSSRADRGWSRRTAAREDRKSTRLNSSHDQISYAVFGLKKKTLAGGAMSKLFRGGQKAASGGIQGDVLATDNNTVGMGDAGIKSAIQSSNVPNPDEAVHSFVSGSIAKAGKGLLEGTLQAGTSAVSDKLLDLVGLGGKSAADKGKDTRDYLAAAFPELNAWERAGADASSAGMVDAGFENQKELTKMQLDNQKELAERQNETQKEIAGIQSATSPQNTKDQVYAQNEMLAYQQKESTARVASIMENTNLSKQQQVSEIMRQMLTQAQTAGQYFTNDQIKEMTRNVSPEVDLVHQQTQNQRYGSSHIGATAKDISNVVTDAASGVVDIFHGIDKAVADTWNNFWKDGKADGIGSNLSRK